MASLPPLRGSKMPARFVPSMELLEDRTAPTVSAGPVPSNAFTPGDWPALTANATVTADLNVDSVATERNFFVDSRGLREDKFRDVKFLRGNVHQFGNSWYFIRPSGDIFEWKKGRRLKGQLLANAGPLGWENPELIVNASTLAVANPAEVQVADQARAFYRASKGNFRFNQLGGQEKWIKGKIDAKSPANRSNPWYFILPNGGVFEWDGQAGLTGAQVAAITPDVNLWQDPSLLTDAFVDLSVNSAGFDEARHFFIDRSQGLVRNFRENRLGFDEKWFRGDSHQFQNNLYFILPNGDLYEWSGRRNLASSNLLANLGSNAWNNLERVVQDFQPVLETAEIDQLTALDMQFSLFRASNEKGPGFFLDALGRKWLTGRTNSIGNRWYYLTPNNSLVQWNGIGNGTQVLATNLPPEVYADPLILADAFADGSVLD